MRRNWIIGLLFAAILAFGSTVHATPSLGVGTGTFDCTGATQYWQCFSGNLNGESFALPASGGTISPFTNITNADIWLLAEPSIGTFTFNGMTSSTVPTTGSIASYQTPYQGIDLGKVNSSWTLITSSVFSPGPFYMLPGTFSFTGTNVVGDWVFLVADTNGVPGLQGTGKKGPNDRFSPKTASAVGVENNSVPVSVPEPGTLLLLGAGLLGLPLFGRKLKRA